MHVLAMIVGMIAPLSAAPQPAVMNTDELASVVAGAGPQGRISATPGTTIVRLQATTSAILPGIGNLVAETGLGSVTQAQTLLAVRAAFLPVAP